jgi:hypothetical protein
MDPRKERIALYRNRAEELRVFAQDFSQEAVKKTLRDLAASYDKMADDLQAELDSGSS